jgi:hypothetical protein
MYDVDRGGPITVERRTLTAASLAGSHEEHARALDSLRGAERVYHRTVAREWRALELTFAQYARSSHLASLAPRPE